MSEVYTDEPQKSFKEEYIELCKKHGKCLVPTHDFRPSAHDPMLVVPLEKFWETFNENNIWEE